VQLPPLILASASPRREELLRQLTLDFQIVPGDAVEIFDDQLSPWELCQLNAHRKARVIAKKHPDALVLGADTLVFLDNEIMGKPADAALRERTFAVSTGVTFRTLTAGQINDYLSKTNPLDKAGAYAIQEHGDTIVSGISGSFSNVVGLPIERVGEELKSWATS
jgi:septum formation protein